MSDTYYTTYINNLKFIDKITNKNIDIEVYINIFGYTYVMSLYSSGIILLNLPDITDNDLDEYGFQSIHAKRAAKRNYNIGSRPFHQLVRSTGCVMRKYRYKMFKYNLLEDFIKINNYYDGEEILNETVVSAVVKLQRQFRLKHLKRIDAAKKIIKLFRRVKQKKDRKIIYQLNLSEDPITNSPLNILCYYITVDFDCGNKYLYNANTINQLENRSPFTRKTFTLYDLKQVNLHSFTICNARGR
jgi:hypothetical protein